MGFSICGNVLIAVNWQDSSSSSLIPLIRVCGYSNPDMIVSICPRFCGPLVMGGDYLQDGQGWVSIRSCVSN